MYHGFAGNGGPSLLLPLGRLILIQFVVSFWFSFGSRLVWLLCAGKQEQRSWLVRPAVLAGKGELCVRCRRAKEWASTWGCGAHSTAACSSSLVTWCSTQGEFFLCREPRRGLSVRGDEARLSPLREGTSASSRTQGARLNAQPV